MNPSPCRFILLLAAGSMLFAGCGMADRAPVATAPEVDAALKRFVQAWQDENLEGVMAMFTADAVAFDPVPPGRFEPPNGVRNWVADTFKAVDHISIVTSDVRIQTSGPVAWLTLRYTFKGETGGKPMSDAGNLSMVWVKQADGSYKSPIFHASVPPPIPPEPAPAAK